MAEPLKNIYNQAFFKEFSNHLSQIVPDFQHKVFNKNIHVKEWKDMELKQRMRHITTVCGSMLQGTYADQVNTILSLVNDLQKDEQQVGNFAYMFLPDFIEYYGLDNYPVSIKAIERITQFTSCEFAIRPFILKYPNKTITQMTKWSRHKNPMVRRLASEGCRPRLPWAMALPFLKKDPAPILSILETLKNDHSESVRRSVANNLNDISKDNPSIAVEIAKQWIGKSANLDRVAKHGCRTLLKAGNQEVLSLFGYGSADHVDIGGFKVNTPTVRVGGSLEFQFQLTNTLSSASIIRLEYGVYYQKANGTLSKKVFKISEKEYAPHESIPIVRKQSFKIITTRKFHPGLHQVSVIVNGRESELYDFLLILDS